MGTDKLDIVRDALIRPEELPSLTLADWDLLISHARSAGVLARLYYVVSDGGFLDVLPRPVVPHLKSAKVIADNAERVIRWEVNRIRAALKSTAVPIILLKGAAYAIAGLPPARGRLASDIDILVPRHTLILVEKTLLQHGWEHVKNEEYDQRFYRNWGHELPPLRHRERKTLVDVHHTILPLTHRLHPDPEKLIAGAKPIDGPLLKVLAPADMVLHSAIHMFHDGYLERGLRELLDLDGLLREFGSEGRFWNDLTIRSRELELTRPCYYALHFSHLYLDTPIPQGVLRQSQRWRAAWPGNHLMDKLVGRALTAKHPDEWLTRLSRFLLYTRSHWLRMPPLLLTAHLLRKTSRRYTSLRSEH